MRMKPPSFLVSSGLLSDPQLCGRSGAHAAALRSGIALYRGSGDLRWDCVCLDGVVSAEYRPSDAAERPNGLQLACHSARATGWNRPAPPRERQARRAEPAKGCTGTVQPRFR